MQTGMQHLILVNATTIRYMNGNLYIIIAFNTVYLCLFVCLFVCNVNLRYFSIFRYALLHLTYGYHWDGSWAKSFFFKICPKVAEPNRFNSKNQSKNMHKVPSAEISRFRHRRKDIFCHLQLLCWKSEKFHILFKCLLLKVVIAYTGTNFNSHRLALCSDLSTSYISEIRWNNWYVWGSP